MKHSSRSSRRSRSSHGLRGSTIHHQKEAGHYARMALKNAKHGMCEAAIMDVGAAVAHAGEGKMDEDIAYRATAEVFELCKAVKR